MVGFNVLLHLHPMVGLDVHDTTLPVLPPPPPFPSPHAVAMLLNGLNTSVMKCTTVEAWDWIPVHRGTDIGMMIPHIPFSPNPLAIVHTLASGSKSEFGAMTVQMNGSPVAVALGFFININLNCSGPSTMPWLPWPSGYVIAPNTVQAGMTLGCLMAGLFYMVSDSLRQGAINKVFGFLGSAAGRLASRVTGPAMVRYAVPFLFQRFPNSHNTILAVSGILIENVPGVIIGTFGLGGPMGYSPDYTPFGGKGYLADVQDSFAEGVADFFNGEDIEAF